MAIDVVASAVSPGCLTGSGRSEKVRMEVRGKEKHDRATVFREEAAGR